MRTPQHYFNLITSQWAYLQLPSHRGLAFQGMNLGREHKYAVHNTHNMDEVYFMELIFQFYNYV